jgi:hypothetical protein
VVAVEVVVVVALVAVMGGRFIFAAFSNARPQ